METGDPGEGGLVVRLFGQPEVLVRGEPMPAPRTRKGLWLLALLALRGGAPAERRWLATLLWPESTEELALYNLRRSLSDLREQLGPEAARLVSPTPRSVALDVSGASVDVLQFDRAVSRRDAASLTEAVSLYRAPLLEGCLEEWALSERHCREQALLAALEELAGQASRAGDPAQAARCWRQALRLDPFSETALRGLMESLLATGDYAAATQAYRDFRSLLRREMNAEPGPETLRLFRSIRDAARRRLESPPAGERPKPASAETPGAPRTSPLPRSSSAIIGRRAEIDRILDALRTHRAVLLTGPGGVGKTRLALAAAQEMEDEIDACFVDLSALTDPSLVPHTVAQALDARPERGQPLAEALGQALASRTLLLVLDNCEHLADACAALIGSLTGSHPSLFLLATSRHVLDVPGAAHLTVPPLRLPGTELLVSGRGPEGPTEALLAVEAVQFFADRARRSLPAFELTPRNAGAVAQICARLDGVPLAIELAAARVRGLTPEQIAARLDDLLPRRSGAAPPPSRRHESLRTALDWSYRLLTDAERALLRRLAVFAGGFSLEAAEAVCGWESGPAAGGTEPVSVHPEEVLDLLLQLLDKSLVQYEESGGEGRYRLLETIRTYAAEKLAESPDEAHARDRHFDHYLALAEEAERELVGPREAEWLLRLDREQGNLRAALSRAREAEGRLRLAAALWRYWLVRGQFREGRQRLEQALAGGTGAPEVRARAITGAAVMAWFMDDYGPALRRLEEAMALFEQAGDLRGVARSFHNLGTFAMERGDYEMGRAKLERARAMYGECGDTKGVAFAVLNLGALHLELGELDRARRLLEESIVLLRAVGCEQTVGGAYHNLALIAVRQGELDRARVLLERSLEVFRRFDHRYNTALATTDLGAVSAALRDPESARRLLQDALARWRAFGNTSGIARSLGGFAQLAVAEGDLRQAVRLFGAEAALREALQSPVPPPWREEHQRCLETARAGLTEEEFAGAWEHGRRLTVEEAIQVATAGPVLVP